MKLHVVFGGLFLPLLFSCQSADRLFCADGDCTFSTEERLRLSALANLPERAPDDPSNKFLMSPGAVALGHKLFYDTRFSGTSLQTDALRRPILAPRAPKGQPVQTACVSCHDPKRAGIDTASTPGHISMGAAMSDTNASSSFNVGFYNLFFWNGRADSLWAQAAIACEGGLMNGNRMHTAWVLADFYRADYDAVFSDHPLPLPGKSVDLSALLETTGILAGQCKRAPGCPTDKGCRESTDASGAAGCWPRFPLHGKPGGKPGCQSGDPAEPFGDAFDCMADDDRALATRILVNFGKAVGAYEHKLVSRDASFDKFMNDLQDNQTVADTRHLSSRAVLGAKLFVGKAGCVECHNTPFFSDNQFHNIGVPQQGQGVPTEADCPKGSVCDCSEGQDALGQPLFNNCLPWGARDGAVKLRKGAFRRDTPWSDAPHLKVKGMMTEAKIEAIPKGAWRTPTLRNIAQTGPYMHDGAMPTLEAVVDHYDAGGTPGAPGPRSARIKPLFLSGDEKQALVEFLKSLTGNPPPAELTAAPTLP